MAIYRLAIPSHIYLDVEADTGAEALAVGRSVEDLSEGVDMDIPPYRHVRVYADDDAAVEIVDTDL
jgi:hypothetical protein